MAQNMRPAVLLLLLAPAVMASSLVSSPDLAAQVSPSVPPPPPTESAPADAPGEPGFDPFRAEKSIEIGSYYMKQGKYDAAIDRFTDATLYNPRLAKPWRLLGEAYEKKKNYRKAIESYERYLQVYATPEDAAKMKSRIARLQQRAAKQEAAKRPRPTP